MAHQALVSPASAQAALLGKIPWKTIVEGVAAAVTALDIWMKIRPDGAERRDTACALATSDITVVNRMCRQLALTTNTREFEASVEPGDGGLLAALQDYVATPNRSNWLRVRNAAIQFLTDAGDLFKELSKPGGLVEKLDAEPQAAILARLRQALIEIEPSLQLLHYDRREPSPSDREAAAEILDRLFGLPKLLDEAVRASQDLMARRSTANCK